MRWDQVSLFITGGAKRIGASILKTVAQKKPQHIILHYNKSETEAIRLVQTLKKLGARKVSLIQGNLASFKEVQEISKNVLSLRPHLNALIFNASIWQKSPLGKVQEKDWDSHVDINLKSAFFLARDLGLAMKKRGLGRIVFLSDWSVLKPSANYIPYGLSKAGLLYLTRALARGLAPEVSVNAILPGAILPQPNTPKKLLEKIRQATLLKRLGTPQDVAHAVFFLLEANFTTGSYLTVDGGRFIT